VLSQLKGLDLASMIVINVRKSLHCKVFSSPFVLCTTPPDFAISPVEGNAFVGILYILSVDRRKFSIYDKILLASRIFHVLYNKILLPYSETPLRKKNSPKSLMFSIPYAFNEFCVFSMYDKIRVSHYASIYFTAC
jgi:hypothetical protein